MMTNHITKISQFLDWNIYIKLSAVISPIAIKTTTNISGEMLYLFNDLLLLILTFDIYHLH